MHAMSSQGISHLNPNSRRTFSGPATSLILAAFVAIKEGKFTRFNKVVSKSWPIANGPSILINGWRGKQICTKQKRLENWDAIDNDFVAYFKQQSFKHIPNRINKCRRNNSLSDIQNFLKILPMLLIKSKLEVLHVVEHDELYLVEDSSVEKRFEMCLSAQNS